MNNRIYTLAIHRPKGLDWSVLGWFLVVSLWMLSAPAWGQTGDDALRFARTTPGVSAVSMGLSGTGIAGVGDASAFFTNPAGLAKAKTSYFSGSFYGLKTLDEGIFTSPGDSNPFDNDVTASGLSSLAYLFKVPTTRGSMVVGAGYSQVTSFERSLLFEGSNSGNSLTDYLMPLASEFTLETDADGTYPEFNRTLSFIGFETYAIDLDQDKLDAGDSVPFTPAVTTGTLGQQGFVDETGRMVEINVGGAVEVAKDVLVGVSLNVPYGTYSFNRELEEDDFRDDNDGTGGTTDFDFLRFQEFVDSDIVGVNMRFGLSAKVNPNTSLGLSIETPTYYSVDDSYSTILSTRFDNGDAYQYGGEAKDAGTGTFSYSFTTPWKVGIGGAYTFGKASISADFEYVDWSQMDMDSDSYNFADENTAISRGLDATTNTRLGISYSLNSKIDFRGGVAVYPDPHAQALMINGKEVDRDRKFVSFGMGYRLGESIRANVAWMTERFDDVYSVYTEVTDAPYVTEEVRRSRFQVGVSFGF